LNDENEKIQFAEDIEKQSDRSENKINLNVKENINIQLQSIKNINENNEGKLENNKEKSLIILDEEKIGIKNPSNDEIVEISINIV